MPLEHGPGFASDEVNALVGFDGSESKESLGRRFEYQDKFPCRVACAINQHYPELKSGFYLNKFIVALVQNALLDAGLHVVMEDNYQEEGPVPEEMPGWIESADDYLLVDHSLRVLGRLSAWEARGGKSAFYHDRYIIEMISDVGRMEEFVKALEKRCAENSVAFSKRVGVQSPPGSGSALQRVWRRWTR